MEYLEKNMSQVENGQLQLTNIYKSFGSVLALNDVSIFTEPGKIHCLLGDNGAGKSTLVNIISGVLTADSGEYLVNGKKVNNVFRNHISRKKRVERTQTRNNR